MSGILTVIGARPQFVKAAVVSRAIAELGLAESIVHTGQHYDAAMSEVFFDELGIPAPKHHLGVGSGQHGAQTGSMLAGIERILLDERPDWVLVYGDTNSTLAGALAAAKHHVPIAHVEAGLRSFNRRMPEEVNRVLTDHLSSLLLCPTQLAVDNLRDEGIRDCPERHGFRRRIERVGDVMLDATVAFGDLAERKSTVLQDLGLRAGAFVLATIHRAENTDDPERLAVIVESLRRVGAHVPVVWPVHPRTRKVLAQSHGAPAADPRGVRVVDPVGYFDMLLLERASRCIVTDSGGVQKEAFFAGVPCVTLRDETEWIELVETGWNTLVQPVAAEPIVHAALNAAAGRSGIAPYGDGKASKSIARLLAGHPAYAETP